MRLLKKSIDRHGVGSVKLEAQEAEDMWHLYNIIVPGDFVTASTVRKVVKEFSGGSTASSRMKFNIKISVEKVEFDAEQCCLRASGKNVAENEYIRMGQYHTIEIEIGRALTIDKVAWDSIYLERLQEACDPAANADLAAVVMHEGLAHVCLLTKSLTLTKARIERRIPKKKQVDREQSSAINKFFDDVYGAIERHIDFSVVKAILVGSPGFLKDDFLQYFNDKAVRSENSVFISNKSKFVKAHTTSGHKHAIEEMFLDVAVSSKLGEVKAIAEVRALERFHSMLSIDADRVSYGFREVHHADDMCAIDELLVTDRLFQSADYVLRALYVALVESVKAHGGKVHLFSSMHVTGQKLDQYTGIAAILRFPVIFEDPEEPAPAVLAGGPAIADTGDSSDDDGASEFNKKCIDGVADMSIFSFL